jgi:flavin reductase (DIM6/NTAB) family NADH-FMN oxidoreductase RutF
MTVNAFTSVSLDPPLVLVCLSVESSVGRAIAGSGVFAVNVLSADQEWLSRLFASPTRPRGEAAFSGVPHRLGVTRAPILDGVACWLECRRCGVHVAGDHVIVLGEVVEFAGDGACDPLVFQAGRYRVVRDRDRDRSTALASPPVSRSPLTSPEGR